MAALEIPAARVTDDTIHGTPAAPGPGASTVLIGGLPAWRTMVDTHACPTPTPTPHGPEKVYMGSTTVLINDQMACRMADILQGLGPPNPIALGVSTVRIGDLGFGMAKPRLKAAFASAALRLMDDWSALARAERLDRLQKAVNAALPTGMPSLAVRENAKLPPKTRGQFDFRAWAIDLNANVLDGALDTDRIAELVNTTYHEGRHGEQWWNVAQYLAGQGSSVSRVRQKMEIPRRVARAATACPVDLGTSEGAMGESVDTSVYGSRRGYRYQAITGKHTDAYSQYRALPEEEDAWRQGDEAEGLLRIMSGQLGEG